ncbi:Tetratricopeptide-like helical [Penicillium alfredii]|uniref:Histone transcription regulator 3 homolog n=1 Tax=Penicillium alfredii TaxID=1506179 RepID=A0A9W9FSX1_9EURO|nr:Tetratricopeptide-like helical [Penicillium alfredii]KAJ5105866.1 Tetratricopeptide-like helical [Penicillium alfredii]
MSSWVALNVEPDEAIEEEVDDTKELQIEEALKLYHNALKLHSQGPDFYPQAAEAYDALLNSEIFKYPESLSDFKRGASQDAPATSISDESAAEAIAEFNVSDSTSSLFQTLYLSYKNYGKYILDSVQDSAQHVPKTPETGSETTRKIVEASRDALGSFAEALERDDTDLNLWRQSARLSSALHSYRLARYCLESVLADDENRLEVRSEQLGLEEIFAEERLRSTLQSLFDKLSASQVPVKKPKKALVKYLKQHADPYPYLPTAPVELQDADPSKGPLALHTSRREITPSESTWESVGEAILQALDDEEQGSLAVAPSRSITISLPRKSPEASESTAPEAESETAPKVEDEQSKVEHEDVDMLQISEHNAEPEQPASKPTKGPSETGEEHSSIDQSAEKQLMESLERQSAHPPESQNGEEGANAEEEDSNSAPGARKRSSASAANEDQPEMGRMKSRRTRARESIVDSIVQPDEITFDQDKYYEDRLEIFVNADDWMFATLGSLFSKVGVESLGSIENLRGKASLNNTAHPPEDPEVRLFQDFRALIKTWNDEKSRLMQQKDDSSAWKDIHGTSKSGLAVFLEHSRKASRKPVLEHALPSGEELYAFSNTVNSDWLHPHETLFEWLKCLLMPDFGKESTEWSAMRSAYASFLWPGQLKDIVVQLLLREDEAVYKLASELVETLERRVFESSAATLFKYQAHDFSELVMIQTIYELHLDIFASVENPGSEASSETKLAQRDRLARWGMLARSSLDHFIGHGPTGECRTNIALRHLWASAFHVNLAGEAQREHILLCLQDLKHILQSIGDSSISLVNNSIMSELSAAAIDQEVLKLKCMDFFAKVFNAEAEDPVSLIEAIEPILEPLSIQYSEGLHENHDMNHPSSHLNEMVSFLDRGDATLRLFLWRRLQEAYQAINYPPKVVSCYLRSVEVIMAELEAVKHNEETSENRQIALLGWLKSVDSIIVKAISLILQESEKAYECVDMDHLQASMSAVARLTRIVHSFVLYEDSVRVGQTSGREFRGALAKSLESFKERMRELHVRCWILQYTLFVEAIAQNKEIFDEPLEDRIHFLRSVHNALGVRSLCRYSQKQFLKLMKSELLDLETKGDYEFDVCQILFDLHGIKFSPFDGTTDHGCPSEKLDRATAIMMIDFVLRQANRMNMKDLSKSELKTTIEKMQQAIGPAKATSQSPQLSFNRRIINSYLKSPVNPANLLRAVQGVAELSTTFVLSENAQIAAKGWYFLLGHAALTKFRSQKRLSPGSTSELDDAISFFRQDLDHGSERWETWYRLAQAYDSKLDEDITWTADKINNNRGDLAATQRNTIHCYAMAVSTAIRTAEPTAETRSMLSDLYSDFGIRMYSSSREPLSMGPFSLTEFARHYSSEESQQMYKAQPFKEMSVYSVWNFASNLLKRAVRDKPNRRWMTQYTLSKCLWKMYSCDDSMRTNSRRVEMQDVLDTLLDAVAALPQRKDSRSDPIFEPHFKLLSVVCKLVLRGDLAPVEASKTLLSTPWARKVDAPDTIEGWKPYILEVLRKFKSADKSNWHHRMNVKAAHIIYDDQQNATAAANAKQELSQIFTKTLTIQVWRPEFERPGRHFVYTTRYVYFFVRLLDQLDDRASLDQLLRRVRKKQGDFVNHAKLWEDICLTYAKLIRRAAKINEGHEEGVFRPIGWEEFSTNTARLESLNQLTPDSQSLLELLRDSLELKKLNNNLMKVTTFEDLIADLYSRVYEMNMPLLVEQANEANKEKMKVDHLLMPGDGGPTEPSTPSTPVPAASDTPAPRGRTKGIARRDIQKRADTIVSLKLAPRAVASKIATAPEADQSAAIPHGPSMAAAPTPNEPTSAPRGPPKQTTATGAIGAHASADESDLSDVDDSKLPKTPAERNAALFPSLSKTEPGESEADDAGSGDEGADDEADDMEGDGDAAATEAETGEEALEGEDEGEEAGEDEEMQYGDGDGETRLGDDEEEEKEADHAVKKDAAVKATENESSAQEEAMPDASDPAAHNEDAAEPETAAATPAES